MSAAAIPLHNGRRADPYAIAGLYASRAGIVSLVLGGHDDMNVCLELTPHSALELSAALRQMAEDADQGGA